MNPNPGSCARTTSDVAMTTSGICRIRKKSLTRSPRYESSRPDLSARAYKTLSTCRRTCQGTSVSSCEAASAIQLARLHHHRALSVECPALPNGGPALWVWVEYLAIYWQKLPVAGVWIELSGHGA